MPENEGSSKEKNAKLFVPVKQPKQKGRDETVCEAFKLLRTIVENDATRKLTSFMKDDLEKSREHDLKLFHMMLSHRDHPPSQGTNQLPTTQHNVSAGYYQLSSPTTNHGLQSNYPQDFSLQQEHHLHQGHLFRPISPTSS